MAFVKMRLTNATPWQYFADMRVHVAPVRTSFKDEPLDPCRHCSATAPCSCGRADLESLKTAALEVGTKVGKVLLRRTADLQIAVDRTMYAWQARGACDLAGRISAEVAKLGHLELTAELDRFAQIAAQTAAALPR